MTRWAHRLDKSQPEIVKGLRAAGYPVFETSRLGDGFPDLLVGSKGGPGQLVLFEVKSPGERLTPKERNFQTLFLSYYVYIVRSLPEALAAMAQYDR